MGVSAKRKSNGQEIIVWNDIANNFSNYYSELGQNFANNVLPPDDF